MEILINMIKQLMQISTRQMAKIPPISSAMAEKMKSSSTTGILFGIPCYSPMPSQPPVPLAKSDWVIWYPSLSMTLKGSVQASTRTRT